MKDMVLINEGRTSEILASGDGRIIKLYKDKYRENAQHEIHASQLAYDAGISVPETYGLISVGKRTGVVMERLRGPSMWEEVVQTPERAGDCGRLLAEIHASIHSSSGAELPPLMNALRKMVRMNRELKPEIHNTVMDIVTQLPDGDVLCHGDFYPRNIILSPEGPVIIDWAIGMRGNGLADHARTWCLSRFFTSQSRLDNSKEAIPVWKKFWNSYFEKYRRILPYDDRDFSAYVLAVAVAGLAVDKLPDLRSKLLALIEEMARAWKEGTPFADLKQIWLCDE